MPATAPTASAAAAAWKRRRSDAAGSAPAASSHSDQKRRATAPVRDGARRGVARVAAQAQEERGDRAAEQPAAHAARSRRVERRERSATSRRDRVRDGLRSPAARCALRLRQSERPDDEQRVEPEVPRHEHRDRVVEHVDLRGGTERVGERAERERNQQRDEGRARRVGEVQQRAVAGEIVIEPVRGAPRDPRRFALGVLRARRGVGFRRRGRRGQLRLRLLDGAHEQDLGGVGRAHRRQTNSADRWRRARRASASRLAVEPRGDHRGRDGAAQQAPRLPQPHEVEAEDGEREAAR